VYRQDSVNPVQSYSLPAGGLAKLYQIGYFS